MTTKIIPFLLLVIIICECFTNAFSQGCSDAGVCEISYFLDSTSHHNIHPDSLMGEKINRLQIRQSIGIGESDVIISKTDIGGSFSITKKSNLLLRVPFIVSSGNLGNVAALGDVIIAYQKNILSRKSSQLNGVIAFRIPTSKSNLKDNKLILPMPYQPGLGTFDLVVRSEYQYKSWGFTAGLQVPLSHINENSFLIDNNFNVAYSESSPYFQTNEYKRGSDIMLRVDKNYIIKKFTFTVSALPIIRIQKDKMKWNGEEIQLDGTEGVTFNAALGVAYKISDKLKLQTGFGTPLITRKVRTDGLTRKAVVLFGIDINI